MKHFQLKPDFHLLNPDFEGYKLSLDALPSYVTPLETQAPLQVHLDNSQYSVQHLKTYGSRSSLVLNPFDGSLVFFGADGRLFQSRIQDGKVLFHDVFRLQPLKEDFSIPPSLLFAKTNLAVISDSKKVIFCQLGGGGGEEEEEADAPTATRWRELKSIGSEEEEVASLQECVLMDAFCDGTTCHVVTQRVKKKEERKEEEEEEEEEEKAERKRAEGNRQPSAFCSELIWTAYVVKEDGVRRSWVVRLESSSSAEFVSVDRSGRFLSIASQHPFKLVYPVKPQAEPITTEQGASSHSAPPYVWSQTTDDVTLSFLVEESVTKKDIKFSLQGSKIDIKTKEDEMLLSGQLHGSIDKDGCCWTLADSILEVTLAKNQLCVWEKVVDGDDTPETRGDSALDAAAIHESLKHLTTDAWNAEPDKPFRPYNSEELEECDYGGDESSVLSAFDRDQLSFHLHASISSNQILFTRPSVGGSECPTLCLRHDVDGVVWQPTNEKEFLDRPFKHLASLHAFGYVSASKTRRRFLTSSSDFSYAVIADVDRHVYVYRQKSQLRDADLRNRKSGQRVSSIAQQQVFSLKNNDEILGVVATPQFLFLLTATQFLKISVNET